MTGWEQGRGRWWSVQDTQQEKSKEATRRVSSVTLRQKFEGWGAEAGVSHLFLSATPWGKCHYSEFLENGNPHFSNLSRSSSKEMVRPKVEGDDPRMSPNANPSRHRKQDLGERRAHVGGFQRGWDGCQQFCDSVTGMEGFEVLEDASWQIALSIVSLFPPIGVID